VHRLLFVAVLLVMCGCGKKPNGEAPCGAVAARLVTIATDELDKAKIERTGSMRRSLADQLPAMRDALVQNCTDGAWSAQVRNCMANAADHAAFQTCQQQLTDAQRSALDQSVQGKTPSH